MPAKTTILARKGPSGEWTTSNPVLAEGEFGFETDTGKMKVGDGTTEWRDLSYLRVDGGEITVE